LRWHHRRKVRNSAFVAVSLAVALVVGLGGPWWWKAARDAYWRSRCMSYVAPPDQVVYSDDPDEATRLLSTGAYEQVAFLATLRNPKAPIAAGLRPLPYGKVWNGYETGGAFLHARTSAGGLRRLVIVGFELWEAPAGDRILKLNASSGSPRTWGGDAAHANVLRFRLAPCERLRLFAGQSDPHDPSHFTIAYEWCGCPGVIDGWLKDGQPLDLPVLQVRDGALADAGE